MRRWKLQAQNYLISATGTFDKALKEAVWFWATREQHSSSLLALLLSCARIERNSYHKARYSIFNTWLASCLIAKAAVVPNVLVHKGMKVPVCQWNLSFTAYQRILQWAPRMGQLLLLQQVLALSWWRNQQVCKTSEVFGVQIFDRFEPIALLAIYKFVSWCMTETYSTKVLKCIYSFSPSRHQTVRSLYEGHACLVQAKRIRNINIYRTGSL